MRQGPPGDRHTMLDQRPGLFRLLDRGDDPSLDLGLVVVPFAIPFGED